MSRRLIVCADDFGLDDAVNAAVEAASTRGILTCASLMVAAPAAADAVERAKRLPGLRVGLHLVLASGPACLPPAQIPDLVDASGHFPDDMARAGVKFFFSPSARRQVAAEIRAQFEAFRATGLTLDHVNAHRHFHLHPTLTYLILAIGRDYGLKAMRVPLEPLPALRPAAAAEGKTVSAPFYTPWIKLLAWRLRRRGIAVNDHMVGLAWTGAMTEKRVLALLPQVPDGVTELYAHPATHQTPALAALMPDYQPAAELAALMSEAVAAEIRALGIELISYGDLSPAGMPS